MATHHDELSAALEDALATFGTLVRRIGWQHRLSDAEVDELVQDVRIRLWHARADSEQIRQVTSSYVYRTAASASLDLLRKRRTRRTEPLELLATEGDERAPASADPAEDLAESELAEQVAQVVDGIAPARRPVVRMHLAGHSREEIAELLGWTEAKTRNLLYRGLADLREGLRARGIGWSSSGDAHDHGQAAIT